MLPEWRNTIKNIDFKEYVWAANSNYRALSNYKKQTGCCNCNNTSHSQLTFISFPKCILLHFASLSKLDKAYILLNLISNAMHLSCFFDDDLYFFFILQYFLNVFRHYLLQRVELSHKYIFIVLHLTTIVEILRLSEISTIWFL